MSTAHEHFAEAKRMALAAMSSSAAGSEGFSGWTRTELAALAQVHATLALAAALRSDIAYSPENAPF